MKETAWLPLSRADLSSTRTKSVSGGITVETANSPYDIPEAVRASYDTDHEVLIIEFRYISSDEPMIVEVGKGLKCHIGKRSNRLYSIEISRAWLEEHAIKANESKFAKWSNELHDVLVPDSMPYRGRRFQWTPAQTAIDRKKTELFAAVH